VPPSKFWIRKTGLDALYFTGASKLLRPLTAGIGIILMLHRVRPARPERFQPNKYLEITPQFLENTIRWLRRNAYEFVSIDEARSRILQRRFDRKFVAITLDDGYRDVKIWAKPVLRRFNVPYTVYVATELADGTGKLWWHDLESIVATNDAVEIDRSRIPCRSLAEKQSAFIRLEQMIFNQPCPASERAFMDRLFARHHDAAVPADAVCMGWDEIREVAADPLATIGAHTVSHPLLAKVPDTRLRTELFQSRRILEDKLQRDVHHLAYPYGTAEAVGPREFEVAAEAGYRTAVTTHPEVLTEPDAHRLLQLPRINVDGTYQRERHLDVLLSGLAPAVWSKMRHIRRLHRRFRQPAYG